MFLLLEQIGSLFQFSQWTLDISPFTHLPKLPGGTFTATPLVWLVVVTVALTTAGLVGFRRRDVGQGRPARATPREECGLGPR